MLTEFTNLREELIRFTNPTHLKEEINHLAGKAKKFNIRRHLTPLNKKRYDRIKVRVRCIKQAALDFQKQVDTNLDRFTARIRGEEVAYMTKNPKNKSPRKLRKNGQTAVVR